MAALIDPEVYGIIKVMQQRLIEAIVTTAGDFDSINFVDLNSRSEKAILFD